MKNRIIKDIRLYESIQPNIAGNALPLELGKLMKSDRSYFYWTTRIARKLNEMQFSFGEADHLYLNFTNCLTENTLAISNRKPDIRIQYVDFGIDFERFNQKSSQEKEEEVISNIFQALQLLTDDVQKPILNRCENIIRTEGKKVNIHYKTKETSTYKVDVSYQIAPDDVQSVMLIHYVEKKSGDMKVFKTPIRFYEDVHTLVDKISIKNKIIELQPKKSYKAELFNNAYKTPLNFELT